MPKSVLSIETGAHVEATLPAVAHRQWTSAMDIGNGHRQWTSAMDVVAAAGLRLLVLKALALFTLVEKALVPANGAPDKPVGLTSHNSLRVFDANGNQVDTFDPWYRPW